VVVAAAVHTAVDATRIRSVEGVAFARRDAGPTLDATVSLVAEAVGRLPAVPAGAVVAERGKFYGEPADSVALAFETEFKYVESIAERETVQAAHHAAYAARELIRR
jgi:hypothetical protein